MLTIERPAPTRARGSAVPPPGRRPRSAARAEITRWLRALLRTPLAGKLAGANAVIVLAAVGAVAAVRGGGSGDGGLLLILAGALGGSLVVNVALVAVALRPLGDLETTATRVWRGDLAARVPPSLLADRDVARIGGTLNVLLDGLTSDRARMRRLAGEVIRAGDRERAHIARELHDSAAQSLAALVYQLSAAERDIETHAGIAAGDAAALATRLGEIKALASSVLEEVRLLAHTVHPRVLDDLGLPAALRKLAREIEASRGVRVTVRAAEDARSVPATLASVLYRVAQEAVNNAVRHASPHEVALDLSLATREVALEIRDDGRGFDVDEAERRRPGMGLFTMRERAALVNGDLRIESRFGRGTCVRVALPLDQEVAR